MGREAVSAMGILGYLVEEMYCPLALWCSLESSHFFVFWSSPNFGPLIGPNLSEDLIIFFLFWSSPYLGKKTDLVSFWSSLFSIFLNFLAPPFRKSCVRYCMWAMKHFRIENRLQQGKGWEALIYNVRKIVRNKVYL